MKTLFWVLFGVLTQTSSQEHGSPLLTSYEELVKVKTLEGRPAEAEHYKWLAHQLAKKNAKFALGAGQKNEPAASSGASSGDGPFAQCQFRDLEMYCLSKTWPAKYFNKTVTYHIASQRCFSPRNVRKLGIGCLVSERAIKQAYLGSKSESTYLIKKNALATKCIRCINRIKAECKACGNSNNVMQVTHGVLHAMPSEKCPNKCLPKLVQVVQSLENTSLENTTTL